MKRASARILTAVILVAANTAALTAIVAPADIDKLTRYQVGRVEAVSLALASRAGRNSDSVDIVRKLGGVIRLREDGIDYLTVVMPRSTVVKLTASDSIEAVAVDEIGFAPRYVFDDDSPSVADSKSAVAGAKSATPTDDERWNDLSDDRLLRNPYPFARDLDADRWRREHPTYDGRGIVIALVEYFPDFLLPELQTALDAGGREIRKFRDVIDTPDLSASLKNPEPVGPFAWKWIRLGPVMRAFAGKLSSDERSFRVPAGSVRYRLGVLRLKTRIQAAYKTDSPFDVLWSVDRREARIDTNRDNDFTNDSAIREYRAAGEFGVLGEDDPQTPWREDMAYALQLKDGYLGFIFGDGEHATMTSSAAAARAGRHGRIDGIAPGAQLLPIYHGRQASTFAQAMITAFKGPADVICLEAYTGILDPYLSAAGRSVFDLVAQRLIDRTGKPLVYTAGNTPGLGMALNPVAPGALNIGAAQSRGATYAHLGVRIANDFILHYRHSEGPTEAGAAKPDMLAPVLGLGLKPAFNPSEESGRRGLFQLPPGYGIGGGTSAAAPTVAGAIALLLSGARQEGVRYDATTIKRALMDSALRIPDVSAHQQGAGLLRVDGAWRELRTIAFSKVRPVFLTRAPVHTKSSHTLVPAHTGEGLFERDGWHPGSSGTRTIEIALRNGIGATVDYDLAWSSQDTFRAPARVVLSGAEPAQIPIEIHPATAGAHSSFLELRDRRTGEVVHRVLCTVVASYAMDAANRFRVAETVAVPQNGRRALFFDVPAGQDALTIALRQGEGTIYAQLISPTSEMASQLRPELATGAVSASIARPASGVWQLTINDLSHLVEFDPKSASTGLPPTVVRVDASVTAVSMQRAGNPTEFVVSNKSGGFHGFVPSGYLGGARRLKGRINGGEARLVEAIVPPGTAAFFAEATGRVNLSLYDCTKGKCLVGPYRKSAPTEGKRYVMGQDLKPGRWMVAISPQDVAESAAFDYVDIVTHPSYGSFVSDDLSREHITGDIWKISLSYKMGESALPGRTPAALLYVSDATQRQIELTKPGGSFRPPYGNLDWNPVLLGAEVVDIIDHCPASAVVAKAFLRDDRHRLEPGQANGFVIHQPFRVGKSRFCEKPGRLHLAVPTN